MAKNVPGLPANLVAMLAQADKQRGFPAGTMASVMQQESGGRPEFLNDPSTYHYGLNAQGKRIAGHTGKVSTAFGPFGILESTGRDPGYGVKPLQNKSIEEQVRFASDYLDARSKSGGSLNAGLAGYGEGEKYSRQVARRRDGAAPMVAQAVPAQAPAPVQTALVDGPLTQAAQLSPVVAQAPAQVPVQAAPVAVPEWEDFQRAQAINQPVQVADLNFGGGGVNVPAMQAPALQSLRPDFRAFAGFKGRA